MQPAIRHLTYDITVPDGATDYSVMIEIARDLSLLNRRLYQSGCQMYHVKSLTVMSSNTQTSGSRVRVSTIPDTWMMRAALKRGCEKFYEQYNEVADKTASGRNLFGKWFDFRPWANAQHTTAYTPLPIDSDGNQIIAGTFDWPVSVMHKDGDANGFELSVLGDHSYSGSNLGRLGLIKSWWQSRNRVSNNQPAQSNPSDDPLSRIDDDDLNIAILDDIESHGDDPPYDYDNILGADYMSGFFVVDSKTIIDGYAKLPSFTVPIGVFRLDLRTGNAQADGMQVIVELAKGNYRGVKAERIA